MFKIVSRLRRTRRRPFRSHGSRKDETASFDSKKAFDRHITSSPDEGENETFEATDDTHWQDLSPSLSSSSHESIITDISATNQTLKIGDLGSQLTPDNPSSRDENVPENEDITGSENSTVSNNNGEDTLETKDDILAASLSPLDVEINEEEKTNTDVKKEVKSVQTLSMDHQASHVYQHVTYQEATNQDARDEVEEQLKTDHSETEKNAKQSTEKENLYDLKGGPRIPASFSSEHIGLRSHKYGEYEGLAGNSETDNSPCYETRTANEVLNTDTYRHQFTRQEVIQLSSIIERSPSIDHAIHTIFGVSLNACLKAKLICMLKDTDDILRALSILRSSDEFRRTMMLFHLHNISDMKPNDSWGAMTKLKRNDLRAVLLHSLTSSPFHIGANQRTNKMNSRADTSYDHSQWIRVRSLCTEMTQKRVDDLCRTIKANTIDFNSWPENLQNQTFNSRNCSKEDKALVVRVISGVEAAVTRAFATSESSTAMNFFDFWRWIGRLKSQDSLQQQTESEIPKNMVNWKELYQPWTKPSEDEVEIADWLRVASTSNELTQTIENPKSAVSHQMLSWRHEWVKLHFPSTGFAKLIILRLKQIETKEPEILIGSSTQVKCFQSNSGFNKQTIAINNCILLQRSNSSKRSLDEWLFAIRNATHPKQNIISNPHSTL